MICVYEPTCTDFSNNGLGAVSPQSCSVTETLNGEWELTLVHPIDDLGKWQRLTEGCILRAPVPAAMTPQVNLVTQGYQTDTYDVEIYKITTKSGPLHLRSGTGTNYKILGKYKKGKEVIVLAKTTSSWYEVTASDGKHGYMSADYLTYERTEQQTKTEYVGFRNNVIEPRQLRDQPFRIYRVVPELDKITVYARHIFYDLLDNMVKHIEPNSGAVGASVVQNISDGCLTEHGFTFYSDLESTAADVLWENKNPVEVLLGDEGLTGKYGAELARDWFDVFLVDRVGSDSDVHIREKKNLTGISFDVDETDVVTRIMPTGEDADGNLLYLPELYIDSEHLSAYPHPKWIHLPVSSAKEVTEGDETKSKSQCYTEMREAVQAEYDAGCDLPTVTLKVDFIDCSGTEEYKQYAALSGIFLGDSVRVIARRIGVEVVMRMTQYTYDCLTRKYTSVTLGTAAASLEGATVSARQLASGSISGTKLMLNSIGSGHLQTGSVGSLQVKNAAIQSAHIQSAAISSAHIQNAAITQAHIAEALIETLNVNALNAVTAKIKELAAGEITTDELYASIAMIATAQLTTANIISANIDWAQIQTLSAEIAKISKAQITTANITEANIDWAAIHSLVAATASIAKTEIGSADISWAQIKDLTTDTAIITEGVGGDLYIARLAVTEANMVSLTVGELVVKGEDGHFYSVSVDDAGKIVTNLKQVSNDDVADLSIHGTEKLIEGSITAQVLNVQDIFADSAIIREMIAANLSVDTLFAREATINALNAMDITSNTYLKLMVGQKADQTDLDALDKRVSAAELKITEDAIVSTVTKSETYTTTISAVQSSADNAQSSADRAQLTADSAVSDAASAQTSANKAQSSADKAQSDIDNLAIGGRNLLPNSKGDFVLPPRNAGSASDNFNYYTFPCEMELGETYTIGADVEITDGEFTRVTIYPYPGGSAAHITIPENGRVTHTFTKTADTIVSVLIYAGLSGATRGNGATFRNVKIEKGNRATDWTPAPEDVDAGIEAAQTTAEEAMAAANQNAADMAAIVTDFNADITSLQTQIDGSITTWFYEVAPTSSNEPAVNWTTTDLKNTHLGDLYYDTITGYCYRWQVQNNSYSWQRITDTDVTKALEDAQTAQDTADQKRRVFYAQPVPPYDLGDLWVQGSGGDILRCQTAKTAAQSYLASDWVLASKYTDDTAAANAQTTANAAQSAASNAQSSADKAQTAADKAQSDIDNLTIGGRNLLPNSDFSQTYLGATGLGTGIYAKGYDGYNGGIDNPTANYHAYIDTDTFGVNVYAFNESNGMRNWKGINIYLRDAMGAELFDSLIANAESSYYLSLDVYQTEYGGRLFGGFYYSNDENGSAGFRSGQFAIESTRISVGSWKRVSVKVPYNNDIVLGTSFRFYLYGYGFSSNSIVYVKNIKLEKGNRATDWSPAPEDMATGEELSAVETRVSKAESSITQNAESITSLVTRTTTVENKFANYSTTEQMNSAIKQESNSISSKVSSTYATKSELSTTDTKAANAATAASNAQSTANTAVTNAANAQSAADSAQTAADSAQSDIDNLDIGGRNLLKNSASKPALTGSDYSAVSTREAGKITTLLETQGNAYTWSQSLLTKTPAEITHTEGIEYSFSVDVKVTGSVTGLCATLDVRPETSHTYLLICSAYHDGVTVDQWVRLKGTASVSGTGGYRSLAGISWSSSTVGSTIEYRNFKFEMGNRATDWTPAPEDVEDGIAGAQESADAAQSAADAAQSTADKAQSTANTNASNITALTTRVTTAEQKITADAIVSTVRSSTAYTADLAGKASTSAVATAQSTADSAKTAASTAQSSANAAQSAADAAQSDIDNLAIGGRNLLQTAFLSTSCNAVNGTKEIRYAGWAGNFVAYSDLIKMLEPSTEYTISYKFRLDTLTENTYAHTQNAHGTLLLYSGNGYPSVYLCDRSVSTITEANNWTVGSVAERKATFTTPAELHDSAAGYRIIAYSRRSMDNDTGTFVTNETGSFLDVKIEKGNRATDWTPAPEDVDAGIAGAQSTATAAQTTANQNATNITNLTTRVSTAESSIKQNATNITAKVSTSTYNAEKVYRASTAPTTLYTDMLWLDTSLTPPIMKRYTGSAWVAVGAQELKTSGISISDNNVTITTEDFLLQLLDPSDNENILMEMSADGNVGFKELYADEVISDSVAPAYAGSRWLWVDPSVTESTSTDFRSLGEAVQTLNNRFLQEDVTIYLPSGVETYEASGVVIQGISGPGRLVIYGYGEDSILNSYIKVKGCFAQIVFQNVHLREIRSMNGSSYQPYLTEIQMSHYVEFNGCTLDANSVTYDSMYVRGSYVYIYNCGLYNALQGVEVYTGQAFIYECCGSCSWSMISYAGIIIASGTVPAGSRGTGNNGQLFASSVTVDYGTAIPTVTPDETGILTASTTRSWRGSWRTDTYDVIQGVYSDSGYSTSLSWHRGCMWFSTAQNLLSGCTVKSATLTLYRKTGSGSSAAKSVYLCAITNTSASGTPSIAKNYGAIGTIGRGKQVTFSIPVDAVQGLADGTYGGLCLYETPYNFGTSTYSSAYMRMGGTDSGYTPYIECVYGGSTAVG